MTNTELLKEKIRGSGLRTGFICEYLGISRQSLHNKLSRKTEFSLEEVRRLCELLDITSLREKEKIFFSNV